MELERLAVALRPRSDWEAVDLGLAMTRSWWRAIYAPWLLIALPLALLSVGWLGFWGLVLFWLLLPIGESAVLTVVSRTVFGAEPRALEVVRQTLRDWRRLPAELSWRRFSTARAYHLPVGQLEGLGGAERRRRIKALDSRHSEAPATLTLCFFFLEQGLFVALLTSVVLLTPQWLLVDWDAVGEQIFVADPTLAGRCFWLSGAAILLFLRPFYVAAGFAIYLNRRTDLEGWDLEIVFRRMARRIERLERGRRTRPGATSAAGIVALLLLGSFANPGIALGQQVLEAHKGPKQAEATSSPDVSEPPRAELVIDAVAIDTALAEVMEREELRTTEEVERWQLREDFLPDWSGSDRPRTDLRWGLGFFELLAVLFEGLLWAVLVLFAGLMLRALVKSFENRPPPRPAPPPRVMAETVAGLDVRRESLPDDVAASAEALWREGRRTEAIRLLYRGALSRLHEQGMELRESFTELDCLARAGQHLVGEGRAIFTTLTGAWQATAYAHRPPSDEQALALCRDWRRLFPAGGAAEATP